MSKSQAARLITLIAILGFVSGCGTRSRPQNAKVDASVAKTDEACKDPKPTDEKCKNKNPPPGGNPPGDSTTPGGGDVAAPGGEPTAWTLPSGDVKGDTFVSKENDKVIRVKGSIAVDKDTFRAEQILKSMLVKDLTGNNATNLAKTPNEYLSAFRLETVGITRPDLKNPSAFELTANDQKVFGGGGKAAALNAPITPVRTAHGTVFARCADSKCHGIVAVLRNESTKAGLAVVSVVYPIQLAAKVLNYPTENSNNFCQKFSQVAEKLVVSKEAVRFIETVIVAGKDSATAMFKIKHFSTPTLTTFSSPAGTGVENMSLSANPKQMGDLQISSAILQGVAVGSGVESSATLIIGFEAESKGGQILAEILDINSDVKIEAKEIKGACAQTPAPPSGPIAPAPVVPAPAPAPGPAPAPDPAVDANLQAEIQAAEAAVVAEQKKLDAAKLELTSVRTKLQELSASETKKVETANKELAAANQLEADVLKTNAALTIKTSLEALQEAKAKLEKEKDETAKTGLALTVKLAQGELAKAEANASAQTRAKLAEARSKAAKAKAAIEASNGAVESQKQVEQYTAANVKAREEDLKKTSEKLAELKKKATPAPAAARPAAGQVGPATNPVAVPAAGPVH